MQKKATLQFKSLDCLLQTYNRETNAKEAMTYRCADINVMVPSIMNVSKVRHCWPLGAPFGPFMLHSEAQWALILRLVGAF